MPAFTAKALIIHPDKKRFLIIQHNISGNILWELPGGKIRPGESPEETLRREIREEVHLDIKVIKKIGSYNFRQVITDQLINALTYLAEPLNFQINLDEANKFESDGNITACRWVTKEDFLSDRYPTIKSQLKSFIKKLLVI